jgi:DNA-binding response OmpR family regulator
MRRKTARSLRRNGGTNVAVLQRAKDAEVMNLPPPVGPSRKSVHRRVDGRRPRVLVAEDDAEMRRLVADALRLEGYEVVEERDGGRLLVRVAAIYSFESTSDPFDLLITDIRMPVCSGMSILQGLRDAKWTTPVILMTAFGDTETHLRAQRLDAMIIDKPFELAALIGIARQMLGGHKEEP